MATVLIVDDNTLDRQLAAGLVKKLDMETLHAANGREAVEVIQTTPPDVVLTDMQMPEMDGLELVEHIKANHSAIPVILMTAHGSEEIAAKALRIGASNYIPKRNLAHELERTLREVLAVAGREKDEQKALACLNEAKLSFILGVANSTGHEPLVNYLQEQLQAWDLCDDADLIRVGTALHEAFVNAIEHGNLELNSALRDDPNGAYQRLADERRQIEPYRKRRVYVTARMDRSEARIKIRDEGPGFDPRSLPDPTDPENIGKISGRGLLLIRTFMDEVKFNETGNEILLVKQKSLPAGQS